MLQIAVIGAGEAGDSIKNVAREVGVEIAKTGHILICGGRGGVMEAAAKGAKSAGGLTIGILPGERKDEANQYIDVKIVTAMSHARNAIITRTGDGIIAVGGRAGTLSEIGLALKIKKPVITLKDAEPEFMVEDKIYIANTPREAVSMVEELCKKK